MNNRYIAFDVETPNAANDRMSAIGITVIEDNRITDELYFLVNPDTDFDYFNINLTGITPEMVADKPSFPGIWEEIEPIMDSGLLIAHNAPFDMSVLAKCLNHYEIDWHPYTYYACTCSMGRACYPNIQNHRLNTLCDYLDISLSHHNAGSDSHACAELLLNYIRKGIKVDKYIRNYDIANTRTYSNKKRVTPSESSKQLMELKSVLTAITSDGVLDEAETLLLQKWMENNIELRGNFPFDKVFDTVEQALSDGVLSDDELHSMLDLFEQITDPVANTACCNDFCITDKTFCLTGEFDYGDRAKVEKRLESLGGIPVKGVTKKTDCLIVGNKGSDAWAAGNYGTKVKKAMEMQEKGIAIKLIKENDIKELLSWFRTEGYGDSVEELRTTVIDYGNGIYGIDQQMVRAFLIVGSDKALLLDTGAVRVDIKSYIEQITDLPVEVILTHGDGDHIGNLQDFSNAYIHPDDMKAVLSHEHCKDVNLHPINEGEVFDIGGRKLKVLFTPGHTKGSISLLDEEHKILFAGDTISYGPVFMFGERRNMGQYLNTLRRLKAMKGSGVFNTVYCCHNTCPIPADTADDLFACVSGILDKSIPGVPAPMPIPTGDKPMLGKVGNCMVLF